MMNMLAGAMLVWFTLTAASLIFVIYDSIANGVTSWVQRVAWILVTFYAGPLGLFLYLMACRRPFPGGHDEYTRPLWKQAVNSEMHCLAGDATGVIAAAVALTTVSLANGWEIAIEYAVAFVSGLFIFQALMMRGMYGGNYFRAVRKTFFAETVSMNMVMTGMIPVMVLLATAWPGSMDPLSPLFWFRMGLATIAGGIVAYPINYWMVSRHLKHGCMTLPGADQAAPHLGHRSPEATATGAMKDMPHMHMGGVDMGGHAPAPKPAAAAGMPGMDMHGMHKGGMDMGGKAAAAKPADAAGMPGMDKCDMDMGGTNMGGKAPAPKPAAAGMSGMDMGGMKMDGMDMHGMDMGGMHGMHMNELPFGKALGVIVVTFAILIAALAATARFTPISFQ